MKQKIAYKTAKKKLCAASTITALGINTKTSSATRHLRETTTNNTEENEPCAPKSELEIALETVKNLKESFIILKLSD